MWNALRADFSEFVTTVTEDTSNVLSQIDTGLSQGDDAVDTSLDAEEGAEAEEVEPTKQVNQAELREIMKLLRDHPGTYTEDLADEDENEAVEEYLKDFSIEAHTDAIAQVLEEHEDTVKKHFEELCPTQVSYEEFWKRYFYRCDEERIATQLLEESEKARQARAEAISAGVKSVTNFFGSAVQAVASTVAPEPGTPETQEGINLFGAKGRPPFVLNTAVSESGEEDDQEDDDDDLGWDDDDDDDDLDFDQAGDPTTESTPQEQIEFTDKVSEDLQEKLKQALEERDQIQQTVQMQAQELKSLQNKLSGNPDLDTGGEVDELKLKLFEKDAELAALKAKAHDDNDMDEGGDKLVNLAKQLGSLPADQLEQLKAEVFGINESSHSDTAKVAELEKQVKDLSKNLDDKEAALAAANDKLAATTKDLEASRSKLSSDQASAQDANAAMKQLEAKVMATQQSLESAQAESAQLRQSAQAAQQTSASQVAGLKQELAAAQQKIAALTTELESTAEKLKQSDEELQKQAVLLEAANRGPTPPTPDSESTGIKVSSPALEATQLDLDEDDVGDDWGDDWD